MYTQCIDSRSAYTRSTVPEIYAQHRTNKPAAALENVAKNVELLEKGVGGRNPSRPPKENFSIRLFEVFGQLK